MCLITCIPSGVEKDLEYLEYCVKNGMDSNRDGSGFAVWRKDSKRVFISKGINTVAALMQAIRNMKVSKEDAIMVHHRIGTQGFNTAFNCHPYAFGATNYRENYRNVMRTIETVFNGGALAHNGGIDTGFKSAYSREKFEKLDLPVEFNYSALSDTALFTIRVFGDAALRGNIFSLNAEERSKQISMLAGQWQKIAIMYTDLGLVTSGNFITDDKGFMHSNQGYKSYTYDRGGSSFTNLNSTESVVVCESCNARGSTFLHEGFHLCRTCVANDFQGDSTVYPVQRMSTTAADTTPKITSETKAIILSTPEKLNLKFSSTFDDRYPSPLTKDTGPSKAPRTQPVNNTLGGDLKTLNLVHLVNAFIRHVPFNWFGEHVKFYAASPVVTDPRIPVEILGHINTSMNGSYLSITSDISKINTILENHVEDVHCTLIKSLNQQQHVSLGALNSLPLWQREGIRIHPSWLTEKTRAIMKNRVFFEEFVRIYKHDRFSRSSVKKYEKLISKYKNLEYVTIPTVDAAGKKLDVTVSRQALYAYLQIVHRKILGVEVTEVFTIILKYLMTSMTSKPLPENPFDANLAEKEVTVKGFLN